MNIKQLVYDHGFPSAKGHLIQTFVGGSALHGVKVEGNDDLDLYGVFIEHPHLALGIKRFEDFVTSTAPNTRKNTNADVDVTCYSLRKWASLAANGNPTILQFLFVPTVAAAWAWKEIVSNSHLFLARSHAERYMGYASAQLLRMLGRKGNGRHGQRPELEAAHGYDTKAAMHLLRLLYEGIELMKYEHITLLRPESERQYLLSVREGKYSMEAVQEKAEELFSRLKEARDQATSLPLKTSEKAISKLLAKVYLEAWADTWLY
ncbi:MAG: nucleotidyltransferase domain-containing protein [Patescibacteria group bacterium]|nr:nucleotidyltransferase domain-containing protein [Patescibacteria group bacterium]